MIYRTWKNFGVGKNWQIWQIKGHLPTFLFRISFSYTCGSFTRLYFTLQLIQISTFANVLPRQNFPTYGIANYHLKLGKHMCCFLTSNRFLKYFVIAQISIRDKT